MEIIGAPFDLCGHTLGSRLGPAAVRLADIESTLENLGVKVDSFIDIDVDLKGGTEKGGLRNFASANAAYLELYSKVSQCLKRGHKPVVIGGDHSLSIGSIGAALSHTKGDLAVLWIDAHADLNTPATSPSGNLHGMPLACLMGESSETTGLKDEQWKALTDQFAQHALQPGRMSWFGLRDVDSGESKRLNKLSHEFTSTMYNIDRRGIVSELERWNLWMKNAGSKNLWISFDVDSLDPFLAPGTGTAVRGGLTYREMHLLAEMLCEFLEASDYQLVGLDMVEINPIIDSQNVTARTAIEWLASLLGKTILGKRV